MPNSTAFIPKKKLSATDTIEKTTSPTNTTQRTEMPTTQQALDVPELFEMILLSSDTLSVRDLSRCRKVCKQWRDRVDASLVVRRRMHLVPVYTREDEILDKVRATLCDSLPRNIQIRRVNRGEVELRVDLARKQSERKRRQLRTVSLFNPAQHATMICFTRKYDGLLEWEYFWRNDEVIRGVLTIGDIIDMADSATRFHQAQCKHHEKSFTSDKVVKIHIGYAPLHGALQTVPYPDGRSRSVILDSETLDHDCEAIYSAYDDDDDPRWDEHSEEGEEEQQEEEEEQYWCDGGARREVACDRSGSYDGGGDVMGDSGSSDDDEGGQRVDCCDKTVGVNGFWSRAEQAEGDDDDEEYDPNLHW